MERRQFIYLYFSVAVFLSIALFQSCVEENIEEKFFSESEAAREYYFANILPILDQKCFSCHNYHNSSATKYDRYSTASSVAEDMASRTSSGNPNTVMPPPSAEPLSEEEKQVFQQFYQLVIGNQLIAGNESADYAVVVSWTAYKFPDSLSRVGVSGTFDHVHFTYENKDATNIYEFITDAEIMIKTNSVNIGDDSLKSYNVRNHFFSFFTPVIYGRVMEVDAQSKKAAVKFTMNGISQHVLFDIKEINEDLVFTGRIKDIGYFNAQAALNALQKVCGEYHQNKVWSDIYLEAEIKNYKKFSQ